MKTDSILLRARVPSTRYRNVERVLERLGLKPSDAVNMFLAQIELKQGLPFEISLPGAGLLSAEEQGEAWTEAFGEY